MILAIVQARCGSTRLPNKIFKKIKGRYLIDYCIKRVQRSKLIDKVLIATSINTENDVIEDYCKKNNIDCFRGDENDVLDRYYQCAGTYLSNPNDIIVRITSDCPLIDPCLIDKTIKYYMDNNYDVVYNMTDSELRGYPSGFDVEVFSYSTLEKQHGYETDPTKREHVMNSTRNSNFTKMQFCEDKDVPLVHLSVDTIKDFELVENVVNYFDDDNFNYYDIMAYLKKSDLKSPKFEAKYSPLNTTSCSIKWKEMPSLKYHVEEVAISIMGDFIIYTCGYENSEKFKGFRRDTFAINLNKPNKWITLPKFPGHGRQGMNAVSIKNKMYCWGGWSYKPLPEDVLKSYNKIPQKENIQTFNDGYYLTYEEKKWSWIKLPNLPIPLLNYGVCTNRKDKIYICGGCNVYKDAGTIHYNNSDKHVRLFEFDCNRKTWKELSSITASPRINIALAYHNDNLYCLGGIYCNKDWKYINDPLQRFYTLIDNWKYNIRHNTWTKLNDSKYHISGWGANENIIHDNKIMLFGSSYRTYYKNEDKIKKCNNKLLNLDVTDKEYVQYRDLTCMNILLYDIENDNYMLLKDKFIGPVNLPKYQIKDGRIYTVGGEMVARKTIKKNIIWNKYVGAHLDLCTVGIIGKK